MPHEYFVCAFTLYTLLREVPEMAEQRWLKVDH